MLDLTLPASPPTPRRLLASFRRPTAATFVGFGAGCSLVRPSNRHGVEKKTLPCLSTGGLSRLQPLSAQRRPGINMNEDTDEMFKDLIEKHGKVVYTRSDEKAPIIDVDDDDESLSFAVALAKVADDVKAADIRVLFVKPLVYWTRFFIIATAFSRPQIDAIGSRIRDIAQKQFDKLPTGDSKPNSWTLLDFGDVVVHIFLPEQRSFYNLEEFYGNAATIELMFENEKPSRPRDALR